MRQKEVGKGGKKGVISMPNRVLFPVGSINAWIFFVVLTNFSFACINLKSLMKFSLSSCH